MSIDKRPIIVVDDERTLHIEEQVLHLRTYMEAMNWAGWVQEPFVLFLDHDLGEGQDSRSIAHFLATEISADISSQCTIYIHSMNAVGAEWLWVELRDKFPTLRIPLPKEMWVD